MQVEAFFLPVGAGQRFCLFHPAQGGCSLGLVLYVHPFAEEMNKARRMAAMQARALAQAGYSVLQIDLLGCGDSSGDFGDATWQQWVDDVVLGCHWLRNKSNGAGAGDVPLWLWGLRCGCLLAVQAARQLDEVCNFLFWQPPASGKPLVQQFLRLKAAGDMLSGNAKEIMATLRQQLADNLPVEVAGYTLAPALVSGMEQAELTLVAPAVGAARLEWFELSTRDDAGLSPVSTKALAQWQQSGFQACSHVVRGPAFWQTSEIEDAPELLAATTAALCKATAMGAREAVSA
jgi:exosortase A-associated hydrolase 2